LPPAHFIRGRAEGQTAGREEVTVALIGTV
jgi:hypothetical protein